MAPKFEYLQYWFMLHRLIDLGMDDGISPLADELRDEMDRLQRELTTEDAEQVDAVSSRLNAERDVATAQNTGRIVELDYVLRWLADEYWARKK